MPVNLSIDPTDPFGSRAQSRYDQSRSDQIYQSNVDNQFRNQQFQRSDEWNWRQYHDSKNRLQLLMQDAKKAGVSPLAALGAGGASPAQINVPVGQGGRVSGGYQRKSPMEVQMSADILKNNKLDSEMKFLQYYGMLKDLQMKTWQYNRMMDDTEPEDFYVGFKYNLEEAKQMFSQGLVPIVNPEANMEANEFIGTGYWAAPRPEGHYNDWSK